MKDKQSLNTYAMHSLIPKSPTILLARETGNGEAKQCMHVYIDMSNSIYIPDADLPYTT